MRSMIPAEELGADRGPAARGRILESVMLGWNVAGITVRAVAAVAARWVALAGSAADSLIEIGLSTVVLWELPGPGRTGSGGRCG
jgi:hypothetical protein